MEIFQGHHPLARTANWFRATGQMPETPTPDVRQAAFYVGMQCEELCEKLAVIIGEDSEALKGLAVMATMFKAGQLDHVVGSAMADPAKAKEMLDGDCDLIWVSVGGAQAQGADVIGAYDAVNGANWRKQFPDGTFHRHPITGKVQKPEGWQEPDLTPFIHQSLRDSVSE